MAVRWSQHSPMFGQWASSQTVLRPRPAHQALELVVVLARRHPGADPVRVTSERRGASVAGSAAGPPPIAIDRSGRGCAGAVGWRFEHRELSSHRQECTPKVSTIPCSRRTRREAEFARPPCRGSRGTRPRAAAIVSRRFGRAGRAGRRSRSLIGAISRSRPVGTVRRGGLWPPTLCRDRDRRLEGVRLAGRRRRPRRLRPRSSAAMIPAAVSSTWAISRATSAQREVAQRAAVGIAEDLADLGVIAGSVDLAGLGDDDRRRRRRWRPPRSRGPGTSSRRRTTGSRPWDRVGRSRPPRAHACRRRSRPWTRTRSEASRRPSRRRGRARSCRRWHPTWPGAPRR